MVGLAVLLLLDTLAVIVRVLGRSALNMHRRYGINELDLLIV